MSNLVDGVDAYALPAMDPVGHYRYPVLHHRIQQLALTKKGRWILSGGDAGFARLHEVETGRQIFQLQHS